MKALRAAAWLVPGRAVLAACALSAAIAAPAQEVVPAPTPTADALAEQMRTLAANPRDVAALIAAGDLSTKLGDAAAAMSLFGRAQAVDPGNPRIAAGRAGALVLLERPGEALRLYDQAERGGAAMAPYLAQRGLAYDLIGQQGYAQRDYRRALLSGRDDETVRRLALSLGISGQRDEAMALLDPLLRRSDRGAWRARACILAIAGDVAGARTIAATMMTGGAALAPFFGRLQWLSPADRAFAVHFGELAPTPGRIADARLAPALAPFPAPAPIAPVAAVAVTDTAPEPAGRERRRARPGRQPITASASATLPAATLSAATPPPTRPPVAPAIQVAAIGRAPAAAVPMSGWAMTADSPGPAAPGLRNAPAPISTTAPAAAVGTPVPLPSSAVAAERSPVGRTAGAGAAAGSPVATSPGNEVTRPAVTAAATIVTTGAATPMAAPAAVVAPPARPAVEVVTITPPPRTIAPTAMAAPATAPEPTPARASAAARRDTTTLAAIIDTIAVPASELDIAAPAPRRVRRPETGGPEVRQGGPGKPEAKKPEAKKPEPKKPDPARAEPARWWVQVAGGANEADLGKEWTKLRAKAPAALRGRTAWTTPLRATNRLLAGPFRTQAEAGAVVAALRKDGVSTFAWQSDAGQAIARLPAK